MNPENEMRPVHPGEILRDEFLAPYGLSAHSLALEIKVPAACINDIIRGKCAITADTALRLARYFGTTPQYWLALQNSYDISIAEREMGRRIEREVPVRNAATEPPQREA